MIDRIIKAETVHINLSPVMFRHNARDYFKAYLDFHTKGRFSPVPFFLCCRAIELALKAMHLESKSQKDVKKLYSHDLVRSYKNLDQAQQTLQSEELKLLGIANEIYKKKEFEYLNVYDAATAFSRFPNLERLDALARKVTGYDDNCT